MGTVIFLLIVAVILTTPFCAIKALQEKRFRRLRWEMLAEVEIILEESSSDGP